MNVLWLWAVDRFADSNQMCSHPGYLGHGWCCRPCAVSSVTWQWTHTDVFRTSASLHCAMFSWAEANLRNEKNLMKCEVTQCAYESSSLKNLRRTQESGESCQKSLHVADIKIKINLEKIETHKSFISNVEPTSCFIVLLPDPTALILMYHRVLAQLLIWLSQSDNRIISNFLGTKNASRLWWALR